MPSYNSIDHIEASILSVLNQKYGSWELLITDDSSVDGSYELLLDYSSQYDNIKVFHNNVNCGAAFSRNKSIFESCGDYIAFLDADDFGMPTNFLIRSSLCRLIIISLHILIILNFGKTVASLLLNQKTKLIIMICYIPTI